MATVVKDLSVKFSEQGLAALQQRSEAAFARIGGQFDKLVRKLQTDIAAIKAAQASGEGEIFGVSVKDVDATAKLLAERTAKLQRAVSGAFRALGTQSSADIERLRAKSVSAFEAIKQSGIESAQAIQRAQLAYNKKLLDLDPAIQAFRDLGVRATAELEFLRKKAVADFATIRDSGVASAQDIARAQAALNKNVINLDPVQDAFRTLGVRSTAELARLRAEAQAAFKAISTAAHTTEEDVARAAEALDKRLKELALEYTPPAVPAPDIGPALAAFKELGVLSALEIKAMRDKVVKAYNDIRNSGVASAEDIARAEAAKGRRLAEIDALIPGDIKRNEIDPLIEAFRELNVKSGAQIEELRKKAHAAFEAIKADLRSTPDDIVRAQRALNERLAALDQAIRPPEKAPDDPFKTLGIQSSAEIEALRQQAHAAFQTIQADIRATNADIERARAALRQKLAALDPVAQSFKRLGVISRAELTRLKKQAEADFLAIKTSGRASAEEIAAAYRAMRGKLGDLDRAFDGVGRSADRQRGPLRRFNAYLASLAFETTGAVFALGALAAGIVAPFKAVGDLAGKFEDLETSLRSLNKEAAQTERDMAFIRDLTLGGRQPFPVDAVVDSFRALKAEGIDPTTGAMETLLDAIAATKGVSVEALANATRAIGQIASKGQVMSEELRGQLAEALAGTLGIAADAMETELPKLNALLKKGALSSKEFLAAFFEELHERFGGAAERSIKTWNGLFAALAQTWGRFKLQIADAGLFDAMKAELLALRETLERWSRDGTLERFAQQLSAFLQVTLAAFRAFVETVANYGDLIIAVFQAIVVAFAAKKIIAAIGGLITGFGALATAWRTAAIAGGTLSATLLSLGRIGLAAAGPAGWIALVALGVYEIYKWFTKADESLEDFGRSLADKDAYDLSALYTELDAKLQKLRERRQELIDTANIEVLGGGVTPSTTALDKQIAEIEAKIEKVRAKLQEPITPEGGVEPFDFEAAVKDLLSGTGEASNDAREAADAQIRLIKDALDRASAELKRKYDAQLISFSEYLDERVRLQKEAVKLELAVLERAAASETDPGKLAKLKADIEILNRELLEIEKEAAHERALADTEAAEQMTANRIRLLELQGRTAEAARLALDEQYKKELALLELEKARAEAAGDTARAAQIQSRIDVVVELKGEERVHAEFEAIREDWERIIDGLARKEQELQIEVLAGYKTPTEAARELVAAYHKAGVELDALIQKLRVLAEASDDPRLKELLRQLEVEAAGFKNKLDEITARIQSGVKGDLTDLFADIITGAKSATEAFRDFGRAVLDMMARILAERFAEKLMKSLNLGSGIDMVIKSIPGFATGGPVEPRALRRARVARVRAYAAGGLIKGPGTGTSDSITGRFKRGTYILKAAAVRKYGQPLLDALRGAEVPTGEARQSVSNDLGVAPGATPPPSLGYVDARVSNGEYEVEPETVRRFGSGFFDALNAMKIPARKLKAFVTQNYLGGFAAGGLVEALSGVTVPRARVSADAAEAGGGRAGQPTAQPLVLQVSERALNATMREWLEGEFARIAAGR